jgi:hypothetical protein
MEEDFYRGRQVRQFGLEVLVPYAYPFDAG